ncbi:hemerythrin domain-containing protein [Streptomyces sp. NPDC005476]|uniref:hemerythrin domain-containing protein n=1 Tax=Streptomyces sp. NPDC005476 TaxID=3156882 RepID=UPI0034558D63
MGHGGNVVDELMTDHREVEEFFGRIEALPSGSRDRKLFADRATMELVRHSVAEEAYLYPAVREHVPGGEALADRELEDHARAEQIMKDLEGCDPGDPEFDRLVRVLMSEIREHVADEEQNLFPRLRAVCPAEALDDLGDKVRKAKKTAPTRPHPAAPDKPPANKMLAPGVGMVDRLRDALTGRGKSG